MEDYLIEKKTTRAIGSQWVTGLEFLKAKSSYSLAIFAPSQSRSVTWESDRNFYARLCGVTGTMPAFLTLQVQLLDVLRPDGSHTTTPFFPIDLYFSDKVMESIGLKSELIRFVIGTDDLKRKFKRVEFNRDLTLSL